MADKICRDVVNARIVSLAPDPASLTPSGRAALAQLRRGAGKPPGSIPEIWQYTMAELGDGAAAPVGRREVAVHVALTQWAMHQQSKGAHMHRRDRPFGSALRLLASTQNRATPQESPAYRRMMALASSRNLAGITTHSRGLIGQLRTAGFGFNYGDWAEDLYWIQVPGHAVDVQRRWGRDFYRLTEDSINQTLDDMDDPTDNSRTSQGAAQ
ncbi:type I-E CRISPR-associated protein Cse2/CasB [Enemella evansiae]|uniref:type I-E CRISPR-associated protein Cse2/CasB n=1 Tax=Enemella evansiae TaxID=2016499 RepID=UPI000B96E5E5|nr:type I-E CRISPR-associated protein Cse2/CasB [Enemella evansiae]OYO16966.1 type I-E CRISPR-associated protein Cse2/CasB [Enemella evansiae]